MESLTLEEVNKLSGREFVERFKGIVEHSEDAARHAEKRRPFATFQQLVDSIHQFLDNKSFEGHFFLLIYLNINNFFFVSTGF